MAARARQAPGGRGPRASGRTTSASGARRGAGARRSTPLAALVRAVLPVPTAPAREHGVARVVAAFARERGLPCTVDRFGNVAVTYRRGRATRPLVLSAHMDHPGFVVRRVQGGVLTLDFLGGLGAAYGAGELLRLYPDPARGATEDPATGTPVRAAGRARVERTRTRGGRLVGARAALVPGRGGTLPAVAAGDLALWDVPGAALRGTRLAARQCDDLAGVVAILAAIDRLWAAGAAAHVVALCTRAEEVGLRGAFAAARERLLPADAIVIAVETSSHAGGRATVGGGPVIRVGDAVHLFSPAVTRWMHQEAAAMQREDRRFRFQRRLMDGGVTEATAYDLFGYETGAVCIALGNYHNAGPDGRVAAETVDLGDLDGMAALFVRLAGRTRALPGALEALRERYAEATGDAADLAAEAAGMRAATGARSAPEPPVRPRPAAGRAATPGAPTPPPPSRGGRGPRASGG